MADLNNQKEFYKWIDETFTFLDAGVRRLMFRAWCARGKAERNAIQSIEKLLHKNDVKIEFYISKQDYKKFKQIIAIDDQGNKVNCIKIVKKI